MASKKNLHSISEDKDDDQKPKKVNKEELTEEKKEVSPLNTNVSNPQINNPETPQIYKQLPSQTALHALTIEPQKYNIYEPSMGKIYKLNYEDVHNDLEKQHYAGSYGWDNACYFGIAEKLAKVDLTQHYKHRTKDEYYLPDWKKLLSMKETQKWWNRIVTFDPFGMTATYPTIAATNAILNLPEFKNNDELTRDGVIVSKEDGSVNCSKAAIYYAWNISGLATRLNLSEELLRKGLFKYSGHENLLKKDYNTFLPSVGGITVYVFGNLLSIRDESTEIAVRVHDECNGSDVFGSDICTCRPYLVFALKSCIEVAQRGGVGIVAYFRKEGRSLGEVIKYRVYNARKNQLGGDRAEKYFYQTEQIAGIRDARFQTMMPDVLNWLGVTHIDWLLSMSSEKYDAIVESGVKINQRVALPDLYVPKHATVEVTAKIAAGYHSDKLLTNETLSALRDLRTIRKQCQRIFRLSKNKGLTHFDLNIAKFNDCVREVVNSIKKNYPDLNVPLHSRFRHFNEKLIKNELIEKWNKLQIEKKEQVRRFIDLITISVLIDAGAGNEWRYFEKRDGKIYKRSEGLACASLDMFLNGLFSSDPAVRTRVNSLALKKLTFEDLKQGLQYHEENNNIIGMEGRLSLLQRLGYALELDSNHEFFGTEVFRPGNILDYLLKHCDKNNEVSVNVLWKAIIIGFESVWPKQLSGIRRGDVWVHNKLKRIGVPGSDMVPFHKLQQWLTYSLIEAIQYYGIKFTDLNQLTCLAEYRNGGILVDTGVLVLKDKNDINNSKVYDVGSELVVEWRAMTIVLIDKIAEKVRQIFQKTPEEFPLSKVLEGGTWRAGRELAYKLRKDGSSPIKIRSDGTVF